MREEKRNSKTGRKRKHGNYFMKANADLDSITFLGRSVVNKQSLMCH